MQSHGFIFYSVGYNLLLSLFVSVLTGPQIWSFQAPWNWLPCPFDIAPSFFDDILIYWHRKMFQAHLVPPLLWLWNQTFLQGALFPFSVEWYDAETRFWMFFFLGSLNGQYGKSWLKHTGTWTAMPACPWKAMNLCAIKFLYNITPLSILATPFSNSENLAFIVTCLLSPSVPRKSFLKR